VAATRPATTRAVGPATRTSQEDEALIRKLLRDATGRGKEAAMERALQGMRASRVKLSGQFDAGSDTQTIQRGILRDLDDAIAEAWRSQRRLDSPPTTRQADRRRKPRSTTASSQKSTDQARAEQTAANRPKPDEGATHGQPVAADRARGALRGLRRGWGALPPRDRDEVVQGFGQDFLTKYREWIERYYRALAEPDRE
jgi:hypothetical protein